MKKKCLESLPNARLTNLYGPTEAAVDVSWWDCTADASADRVPIGRPISNLRLYVLDARQQPVPLGVAGEIYIGGIGVGRGYLHQPERTAEKFIADVFHPSTQGRLYKTGDVGRWRSDGALEYLGRNDHQVKIRGFRIELGEIESNLRAHGDVKDVVVIAREPIGGEKYLVAYVVPRESGAPESVSTGNLREYLKSKLPEHMVPTAFVFLTQMPLSPNGKLDRRALPDPELAARVAADFEPPCNQIEEILCGIWTKLLRAERIGRRDNFFRMGGHSLLAARLVAHVNSALEVDLPLQVVFERPTIEELGGYIIEEIAAELATEEP